MPDDGEIRYGGGEEEALAVLRRAGKPSLDARSPLALPPLVDAAAEAVELGLTISRLILQELSVQQSPSVTLVEDCFRLISWGYGGSKDEGELARAFRNSLHVESALSKVAAVLAAKSEGNSAILSFQYLVSLLEHHGRKTALVLVLTCDSLIKLLKRHGTALIGCIGSAVAEACVVSVTAALVEGARLPAHVIKGGNFGKIFASSSVWLVEFLQFLCPFCSKTIARDASVALVEAAGVLVLMGTDFQDHDHLPKRAGRLASTWGDLLRLFSSPAHLSKPATKILCLALIDALRPKAINSGAICLQDLLRYLSGSVVLLSQLLMDTTGKVLGILREGMGIRTAAEWLEASIALVHRALEASPPENARTLHIILQERAGRGFCAHLQTVGLESFAELSLEAARGLTLAATHPREAWVLGLRRAFAHIGSDRQTQLLKELVKWTLKAAEQHGQIHGVGPCVDLCRGIERLSTLWGADPGHGHTRTIIEAFATSTKLRSERCCIFQLVQKLQPTPSAANELVSQSLKALLHSRELPSADVIQASLRVANLEDQQKMMGSFIASALRCHHGSLPLSSLRTILLFDAPVIGKHAEKLLETIIHDFRDQKKRRDIKVGGALLPWALRVIGKLLRATTVDVPDTQRAIIDMLLCAVESLSSATQHAALETAFVVFECQGIDFAKHLAAKMAPRAADCLRRRCSALRSKYAELPKKVIDDGSATREEMHLLMNRMDYNPGCINVGGSVLVQPGSTAEDLIRTLQKLPQGATLLPVEPVEEGTNEVALHFSLDGNCAA